MTTLVVGASEATGRLLVKHLLDRGQDVKVIVRSSDSLPEASAWKGPSAPKPPVGPRTNCSLREDPLDRRAPSWSPTPRVGTPGPPRHPTERNQ